MGIRRLVHHLSVYVLIVSLLLSSAGPAVRAQEGGPIYLPIVGNRQISTISRADLEKWISYEGDWTAFTYPDGGITVEIPAQWILKTFVAGPDSTVYYAVPPEASGYPNQAIQIARYANAKQLLLEDWLAKAEQLLGVAQYILNALPQERSMLTNGEQVLEVYGIPSASPEVHLLVSSGDYIFDIGITTDTLPKLHAQSVTPSTAPDAPSFRFPLSSSETNYSKFGDPSGCGPYHNGVDYHVAEGADVYAVANGEVIVSKENPPGYGHYITLSHRLPDTGEVIYSVYAHLNERRVTVGDRPGKGHIIGKEGATGVGSNGIVHLHFELRKYWDLDTDQCGNYTLEHLNARFYNPDKFIPDHIAANVLIPQDTRPPAPHDYCNNNGGTKQGPNNPPTPFLYQPFSTSQPFSQIWTSQMDHASPTYGYGGRNGVVATLGEKLRYDDHHPAYPGDPRTPLTAGTKAWNTSGNGSTFFDYTINPMSKESLGYKLFYYQSPYFAESHFDSYIGYDGHDGHDFAVTGDALAAATGTVAWIGNNGDSFGSTLSISGRVTHGIDQSSQNRVRE